VLRATGVPSRFSVSHTFWALYMTTRLNRLISACSSLVTPARFPAPSSAWRYHLRSISADPMPGLDATAQIVGHTDGYFGRASATTGPRAHATPADSWLLHGPRPIFLTRRSPRKLQDGS